MLCPVCNVDLVISERQGIEIDYCPKCRGIWLDRGELDKMLDRSANYEQQIREKGDYRYNDDDYRYQQPGDYKKKKRKSFLDDLFDL